MIVLKSENKIDLERKIRVIDKLINEFTEKLLRIKNETLKAGYNTFILNLNDQKIRIQKLLNSHK